MHFTLAPYFLQADPNQWQSTAGILGQARSWDKQRSSDRWHWLRDSLVASPDFTLWSLTYFHSELLPSLYLSLRVSSVSLPCITVIALSIFPRPFPFFSQILKITSPFLNVIFPEDVNWLEGEEDGMLPIIVSLLFPISHMDGHMTQSYQVRLTTTSQPVLPQNSLTSLGSQPFDPPQPRTWLPKCKNCLSVLQPEIT